MAHEETLTFRRKDSSTPKARELLIISRLEKEPKEKEQKDKEKNAHPAKNPQSSFLLEKERWAVIRSQPKNSP